jgi:hypothetical protein
VLWKLAPARALIVDRAGLRLRARGPSGRLLLGERLRRLSLRSKEVQPPSSGRAPSRTLLLGPKQHLARERLSTTRLWCSSMGRRGGKEGETLSSEDAARLACLSPPLRPYSGADILPPHSSLLARLVWVPRCFRPCVCCRSRCLSLKHADHQMRASAAGPFRPPSLFEARPHRPLTTPLPSTLLFPSTGRGTWGTR